jgi:hypothetical protein
MAWANFAVRVYCDDQLARAIGGRMWTDKDFWDTNKAWLPIIGSIILLFAAVALVIL